jgi:transposase
MTQLFLPVIPQGATRISDTASVVNKDGRWVYFFGPHPIFEHNEGDNRMFKVVTSQLIHHGACRHRDIMATFGVSKSSVNRALKKYREGGFEAFFRKRKGGRRGTVLTDEKLEQAQKLLDEGLNRGQAAEELGIKKDTLRKAINDGRLVEIRPTAPSEKKTVRTRRRET